MIALHATLQQPVIFAKYVFLFDRCFDPPHSWGAFVLKRQNGRGAAAKRPDRLNTELGRSFYVTA
jgi:hypothetical protein